MEITCRKKAEAAYEAFLQKVATDPHSTHHPCALADMIWHEKLQDTYQYAADCEKRFGAFLHHIPAGNGEPYCAAQLEK